MVGGRGLLSVEMHPLVSEFMFVLEPRRFSISDVGSLGYRAFPALSCTVYIFVSCVQYNLVHIP